MCQEYIKVLHYNVSTGRPPNSCDSALLSQFSELSEGTCNQFGLDISSPQILRTLASKPVQTSSDSVDHSNVFSSRTKLAAHTDLVLTREQTMASRRYGKIWKRCLRGRRVAVKVSRKQNINKPFKVNAQP